MLLLPSPPAANSFLEKRIHSARIVDWLVVCLACICLHIGKNLKDDGIRQEDVVIFLNFIFVFFFYKMENILQRDQQFSFNNRPIRRMWSPFRRPKTCICPCWCPIHLKWEDKDICCIGIINDIKMIKLNYKNNSGRKQRERARECTMRRRAVRA